MMNPATLLQTLNPRLSALQLPTLTADTLAALPTPVTVERLTHAVHCAEQNDAGARLYLIRNLPASARDTPAPRRESTAAPPPTHPQPTPAPSSASTPTPTRPQSISAPGPASTTAPTPTRPQPMPTPEAGPPVGAPTERVLPDPRSRHRIYATKAALLWELDETRQHEPTLRLEAAPAMGAKLYDWKQKISLQLTREELPWVAAAVLGLTPHCEFKHHGPENNKGFRLEHQGSHLFVRVFQKDRPLLALPINAADCFYLAALCLRPLRQASPWLSDQGLIALLRLIVQRMATGGEAPPAPLRAY